MVFFGSLGGGTEPAREAADPAATEGVEQSAPEEPSAEEIASQEEADRVAAEQKAADDAAKAEADRVAAEQEAAAAAAAEAAKGTVSQQNAYRSAESYLRFKGFSRAGLINQLTSEYGEGFPAADAEFAVARLEAEGGVDWNAEAAEAAKSYLELTSFSRQGLLDQLTSEYGEQFTPEQAEYGVSQTGL
ncbi:Ltp family lipoprotein [Cellulomonas sp. zg-ZUI168]|nr:Ltp family lipoprotein [Cellulomonas fengjieae]